MSLTVYTVYYSQVGEKKADKRTSGRKVFTKRDEAYDFARTMKNFGRKVLVTGGRLVEKRK